MFQLIDESINTWMTALHGESYPQNPMLRLATFAFCASLPKIQQADLSKYPEGNMTVDISIAPQAPEYLPKTFEPKNLLEQLLAEDLKQSGARISIPKQYVRQNHLKGVHGVCDLFKRHFNADTVVLLLDSEVVLEVYSKALRRTVTIKLSSG